MSQRNISNRYIWECYLICFTPLSYMSLNCIIFPFQISHHSLFFFRKMCMISLYLTFFRNLFFFAKWKKHTLFHVYVNKISIKKYKKNYCHANPFLNFIFIAFFCVIADFLLHSLARLQIYNFQNYFMQKYFIP